MVVQWENPTTDGDTSDALRNTWAPELKDQLMELIDGRFSFVIVDLVV